MSYINGEGKIIKEKDENIYHSISHTLSLSGVSRFIRQLGGQAVTRAAAALASAAGYHSSQAAGWRIRCQCWQLIQENLHVLLYLTKGTLSFLLFPVTEKLTHEVFLLRMVE